MRKSLKKGMAMLLAAAMVFSTPVALDATTAKAAEVYPYADSLIGYYSFDNTLANAVGNGTATLHGGGSTDAAKNRWDADVSSDTPSYAEGKSGKAFDFQGEQTNGLKLDTKITGDAYTISFFAQMDSYQSYKSLIFNGKNGEKPNAGYNLAENWGGETFPTLRVWGFEEGADVYSDAWQRPAADGKTWVHIAVTYADGTLTLYRDGLQMDQKTGMERTLATIKNHDLFVGINFWDGTIDGRMDDLAIYSKALEASQIYKLATGKNAVVDGLLGDATAELSQDGEQINLSYSTKMPIADEKLSIKIAKDGETVKTVTGAAVNVKPAASGAAVAEAGTVSGAATYVYTPEADGEYTFTIEAAEQTVDGELYLAQKKTASITVMKDGNRFYVKDDTLFTNFGVAKTATDKVFRINWTAVAGVTVSATVKGPDGKQVGNALNAPGNVTVSAEGEYTVDIVAKKDSSIKKDSTKFTYKATATGGGQTKADKFSKVTTAKPLYKYTFDDAKEVNLTGSKAKVEGGVLKLAPTAGKHGEYFAKIDSMTADDFSKGITFIADVNVAAVGQRKDESGNNVMQDWTPFVIFGDGTPAKKEAAGATYRWAITQGFSSKAGTSANYHAAGYYGSGIKAPYTWDYFNTAANRNKWYTIAVTVKKNEMITYINGAEVQKETGDYSVIINGMKKANNNYLGASYWDADDDFAGSMDDVAVYNTALSAADIMKLKRDGTTAGGTGTGGTGGGSTAKVSKVSITVPNRKAGKTIYMKKGDKVTLKATVKGSGKYSKSVTWKTSKKSVATVSSKGKVTAKKAGIAKITATSKTDKKKKATITIKVSKKAVKNKVLKISPTKKTLKKGKSLTIKIKKITKKTTDKITYKSSKKSVATVDAYGKVKAKKKGKATITVKCGKKSAKLKLTVKK